MLLTNRKAKIWFPKSKWRGITPAARDLVKWMLLRRPEQRITIKDALTHPWIRFHTGKIDSLPVAFKKFGGDQL